MSDEIDRNVQSAMFHLVKGSIFVKEGYSYRVSNVYQNNNEAHISDRNRLEKRIKNKIMKMNNDRLDSYPRVRDKRRITEITKLSLYEYITTNGEDRGNAGNYSLFPLEFICNRCGKIFNVKISSDLKDIPNHCDNPGCGGTLEQNTIVLYCEDCGKISSMDCYCGRDNHGGKYAHISRPTKDEISTWTTYCSKCKENGVQAIDFLRYNCSCGSDKKRHPMPVKDGGLITPVLLTFVDLDSKPKCDKSEMILIAIDEGLITNAILKEKLPPDIADEIEWTENVGETVQQIMDISGTVLGKKTIDAMSFIDEKKNEIEAQFENVDMDELGDVRAILTQSKENKYDDYIKSLPGNQAKMYADAYEDIKRRYHISEICYVKGLKIVMSTIGIINGYNKFYEEEFIPHFEPFRVRKENDDIYAMVYPFETEGIFFRLDPIEVCKWLLNNNLISKKPDSEFSARNILRHLDCSSEAYDAVKTLIHTFSHILIKQSSVYTGLDEGTCSELVFPSDASFLIYSTSNVNIGGFEYAFRYSIPNWFSRISNAAEDCTFDPTCMKEGGKCFSCLYVAEHVCCNFNKNLSRQTLIGGPNYEFGYWR